MSALIKKRAAHHRYTNKIPVLAAALASKGKTEAEIIEIIGVSRPMFYRWKKKYPELATALKEANEPIDDGVEQSLLKRAMGYEYEETEIQGVQGENGIVPKSVKKVKKQMAPDVTACIFWLKNRRPAQWRDVHKQEVSGPNGTPVDVRCGTFDLCNPDIVAVLRDAARERNADAA